MNRRYAASMFIFLSHGFCDLIINCVACRFCANPFGHMFSGAQVLVAYGLTEATFNEDNQTIAETFTGIKTYLGDKDKR